MNGDVYLVLGILAVAIVLFVTEWVRYDGVTLVVLLALAITGLIPMPRSIEGFANPAVVTIAATALLLPVVLDLARRSSLRPRTTISLAPHLAASGLAWCH